MQFLVESNKDHWAEMEQTFHAETTFSRFYPNAKESKV